MILVYYYRYIYSVEYGKNLGTLTAHDDAGNVKNYIFG